MRGDKRGVLNPVSTNSMVARTGASALASKPKGVSTGLTICTLWGVENNRAFFCPCMHFHVLSNSVHASAPGKAPAPFNIVLSLGGATICRFCRALGMSDNKLVTRSPLIRNYAQMLDNPTSVRAMSAQQLLRYVTLSILRLSNHTRCPRTGENPSTSHKQAAMCMIEHPFLMPNWQCCVCRGDSSDEDSDEDERSNKPVPDWARGRSLLSQLIAQVSIDPDEVFQQHSTTCPLDAVFGHAGASRHLVHFVKPLLHLQVGK